MKEYDPKILQEAVDRLYSEARGVVLIYSLIGICLGFVAALFLENTVLPASEMYWGSTLIFFGVGFLFYRIGKRRSWELRFRAQQVRLHMQIEENTRRFAIRSVEP